MTKAPPYYELHSKEGLRFNLRKGYRTKRVGFIGDGASKLLLPSPF